MYSNTLPPLAFFLSCLLYPHSFFNPHLQYNLILAICW